MSQIKIPLRKMKMIVAVDLEGGIGKNGSIPWHLRQDMRFFMQQTSKVKDHNKINAVIMGRKCWDSIPSKFRPLKNRLNIVISRTLPVQNTDHLIVTNDFDAIMKDLSVGNLSEKIENIWNIGGREIYELGLRLNLVDTLVVTKISARFDADVFVQVNWEEFSELEEARSETHTENDIQFTFHTFKHRTALSN